MASKHLKIRAELRQDAGKGASRRLRRAGKVPAVIYGDNRGPVSLQLDHEELVLAVAKPSFLSSILDLEVDGQTQPILVRDLQMHPYKRRVLHLDLMRVNETEEIRVNVPLNFLNKEISPAGKAVDVLISHNLMEVEVACLAANLPDRIDVDLKDLALGDTVHLSDLVLPEGVELVQLRLGAEHDEPVVSAVEAAVEEEPEVVVDESAAAEGEAAPDADAAAKDKAEGEDKKGADKK